MKNLFKSDNTKPSSPCFGKLRVIKSEKVSRKSMARSESFGQVIQDYINRLSQTKPKVAATTRNGQYQLKDKVAYENQKL